MAGAGMGQMARGKSWTSVPTEVEGLTKQFPDVDFSAQGVKPKLSNNPVTCRLVKNDSGSALMPALLAKYKTGEFFTTVSGTAGSGDYPAGVVDEFLPATGVPNGSWFWVVTEGPSTVTAGGSSITAAAPIAAAAAGAVADASSPPTANDVGLSMAAIASGQKGRAWVRLPYTGT